MSAADTNPKIVKSEAQWRAGLMPELSAGADEA